MATSQTLTIPAVETGLANTYTYTNAYTPTDQPLTRGAPAVGGLPAETLATTYSNFGNPQSLVGASTYVHGTRFTVFDEPARLALREGGNAWMSFERDPQTRRLTRANLSVNSAQPQISDFTYTYDEAGNVRSSTEVIGGGATATSQRQCYRYDSLRQLVEAWSAATCPASTTDSPVAGDITGQRRFWTSWVFDDDGGRTQQVERAVGGHVAQTITTAYTNGGLGKPFHSLSSLMQTVNGVDTNRGYSYDAAGNTATRGTAAGSQSVTWTADNLVASVTTGSQTSSYVYLADGSQVIRRDPDGTTLFLPDGEVKRTTAGVSTGTRFYQHAGVTVAVRVGGQAPKLQFADPQGTALITVDWSSNATTRRYMDPYGNQMGAVDGGAWPTSRGFLQAPVSSAHGVVDMGARKYDPVIGRFLSVDPIMDPAVPAQNNGYNYGWNSPSTFSDPSGRCVLCFVGVAIALAPKIARAGRDVIRAIGSGGGGGGGGGSSGGSGGSGSGGGSTQPRYSWRDKVAQVVVTAANYHGPFAPQRQVAWNMKRYTPLMSEACRQSGGDPVACSSGPRRPDFFTGTFLFGRAVVEGNVQEFKDNPFKAIAFTVATGGVGRALKSTRYLDDGVDAIRACSFAAPTLVLMADGTHKPIGDIRPGDLVVATDPETGEQIKTPVTHVWVHEDIVVDLVIDGVTVTTTEDHPFWSHTDKRFERADELHRGELVLTADGRLLRVGGIAWMTTRTEAAYNLTVEGIHTYHVSPHDILVHNTGACNLANAARLRAQLTGQEIAGGHAFKKHVLEGAEFPGISTRKQFAAHIEDVVSGGSIRSLNGGRTAYWRDGTVVIRNPEAVDGGTAFRPKAGIDYFLGLN